MESYCKKEILLHACTSHTLNKHQRNGAPIEREQFALSHSCKKFRIYLIGKFFIAHPDHKPLIGLQKKIHLIENQRLLSMVLATTEFLFELKYLPGKKNILAGYGTRHILDTAWPVEQEDPLELSDLFPFSMVSTILEYPDIQKHMYSSEDFEEITSAGFTLSAEQDNNFTLEIKGKQKIFIPKSIR